MENEALMHKIRSLLRRAEGTDSEHEAIACLEKAQQMMMVHAVSEEELWASEPDKRPKPVIRTVGVASNTAGAAWVRVMLSAAAKANRCKSWQQGDETYIAGMENDILYVEMLFASIKVQMNFALAKAIADSGTFGQKTKTFRANFIEGYARRIHSRLMEFKATQDNYHGNGKELVLVRTANIEAFLKSQGINIVTTTIQSGAMYDPSALRAGAEAGEAADISGGKNQLRHKKELSA